LAFVHRSPPPTRTNWVISDAARMTAPSPSFAAAQLAMSLRHEAESIRARLLVVSSGARLMRWRSDASAVFHQRLQVVLDRMARCATEFDHAADAVLALAARS
jgi:hypothetical protein